VLLGMSFFAIYCGFIYNELFGVSLNMFNSAWLNENENGNSGHLHGDRKSPYTFGNNPSSSFSFYYDYYIP
jgi:hypothetical protein